MIIAGISSVILLFLALVHFYWAAGGKLGHGAAIPELNGLPVLNPGAFGTFVVALFLLLAAIVVAVQAGFIMNSRAGGWPPRIATNALALIFAARAVGDFRYVGFFKTIKGTRFARLDTLFYSPLCAFLAVALAIDANLAHS